jgi:DNA-binding beta-propeller fold protein YncE
LVRLDGGAGGGLGEAAAEPPPPLTVTSYGRQGNGAAPGQFFGPCDAAFTPDGQQLVVADWLNRRIQVVGLDGSGGFAAESADDVAGPPLDPAWLNLDSKGVAVDRCGNILVVGQSSVHILSRRPGTPTPAAAAGGGQGEAEWRRRKAKLGGLRLEGGAGGGVAVDPTTGRVAVSDTVRMGVHLLSSARPTDTDWTNTVR